MPQVLGCVVHMSHTCQLHRPTQKQKRPYKLSVTIRSSTQASTVVHGSGVAGAGGAGAVAVGERLGHHPGAVRQAGDGPPVGIRLCGRRGQHPGGGPFVTGEPGDGEGGVGGVPGVGLLPGRESRRGPRAAPAGTRRVARLLPPADGGEAALRQLAGHVRGLRQPPRRREGRHPRLGRLLLPPRPAAAPPLPRQVAAPSSRPPGDDGGVQPGDDAAVRAADGGDVGGAGRRGGAAAGGVRRRGGRRRVRADQLLPALPAAGAHARPLLALRPRRHDRAPRRRPRQGPSGAPRRRVGHRGSRAGRLHRQRRRPNPGADQRDVPERGAPRDGERRRRAVLDRALLQPQERPAAGAHAGARVAGEAAAVRADDLRRVPPLHPPEGPPRQEPGRVAGSGEEMMMMMIYCGCMLSRQNKTWLYSY